MKFFIKHFFSNCDQIRSFLKIWSHLLKKSLKENFVFCAVYIVYIWHNLNISLFLICSYVWRNILKSEILVEGTFSREPSFSSKNRAISETQISIKDIESKAEIFRQSRKQCNETIKHFSVVLIHRNQSGIWFIVYVSCLTSCRRLRILGS